MFATGISNDGDGVSALIQSNLRPDCHGRMVWQRGVRVEAYNL
jgi:hypothetical protein